MLAALLAGHAGGSSAAWQKGPHWRRRALTPTAAGPVGLHRLPGAKTGLTFVNRLDRDRAIDNRNLLSGSGVAFADVDGDGWCDVYLCGLDHGNALYRNLGHWRFEDITEGSGVACKGQDSMAAAFADLNGDGAPDLVVNSLGNGVRAFVNDGRGRFTEITEQAGLKSRRGGMSLALADVDGDNDLDLYVVNYRTTTIMDQPKTTFRVVMVNNRPLIASVNGVPATTPELTNRFILGPAGNVIELGEPDDLFLNDGQGRFTRVSFTGGAFQDEEGRPLRDAPRDWGLSAQFHDINGDGAPDLYVCDDLFSPDHFWINDGRGRFRAIGHTALRSTSTFSMGIDFGDLDRDGHVDFVVVDMLGTSHKDRHTQVSREKPRVWPPGVIENRPQVWRNTVQHNRGDATFAEIAFYAGLEASNWSWMPLLMDVDLDGYLDMIVPNGQLFDVQNVDMQRKLEAERAANQLTAEDIRRRVAMFPDFRTPNLIFRNRGDLTFEEMKGRWGFHEVGMSQGTAAADLDNDGDLDLITNNLNEEVGVYRNDNPRPRLAVRLRGRPGNPRGIGAKIVVTGGPVYQSAELIAGGHYLSHGEPLAVFAAGALTNRLRIEVTWRDGARSVVENAAPNFLYEIDQAGAQPAPAPPPKPPSPWFADATPLLLGQRHHETDFNDFERQSLLPRKLSQLGPGVAWHDLDGDGWDDLIIGTGRDGTPAVFRNNGRGGFTRDAAPVLQRPAPRDLTTVLGMSKTLVFGAANYEDGRTNGGCLRIYNLARQSSGDSVLGQAFSTGPLALGDVNGDGVLDLFVGGRVVAGRYPEPATSLLFLNQNGRLTLAQRFSQAGLVSGALFTDLTGDGRPELVWACDWGPVRVFQFDGRQYQERTRQLGLADFTGWWNGVNAGDFDGDGRLDLVAANWGLNSFYGQPTREHPEIILYGDLDESGTVQIIEARYKEELHGLGPQRGYLAVVRAMPFIQETCPTFEAYGTATISQIYGEWLQNARRVQAGVLASMLFLNRGDHFEARPLPAEAQFSAAFGVSIGDLDGDGHEDVFLSQNFFATAPDYTRLDAGRGLVLRGDGHGGLTPVPGQESGIEVYGEQRGCALADYDGDGRLDLVVTQNAARTRLFRNRSARPGLRIRLQGGPGNPHGVGAVLRVGRGDTWGPAREIHAGAGYWSTDSPVQVMTCPDGPPERLRIRWPGGRVTDSPIPPGAREITVTPAGRVQATSQ